MSIGLLNLIIINNIIIYAYRSFLSYFIYNLVIVYSNNNV